MISVAQPSTFKWHFHFSSNFIDFSIFRTCICLFWVITTTCASPPPPSTPHLPPPPPSRTPPPTPPPPSGLVRCPSHHTLPLGGPKVHSRAHTFLFWALPPIAS